MDGSCDNNNDNKSVAPYYYVVSDFGQKGNYDVTCGNPHRGLCSAPWMIHDSDNSGIPYSLEGDYFKFSDVVVDDNNTMDWSKFEQLLTEVAARHHHFIPRFYIEYPGEPLALPPYLLDGPKKVELFVDKDGNPTSTPNYGDPYLLEAIEWFLRDFGAKYDGDPRIDCIQMGLIGSWGEWHSSYEIPQSAKDSVIQWYDESFTKTKLQYRYPDRNIYERQKFGYHDDSFTFSTLDGDYDGGSDQSWYFMRQINDQNQGDHWKYGPMGGEVRPENCQMVFNESVYPVRTYSKQDITACIELTHCTYMKCGPAFTEYRTNSPEVVAKANYNSARMGYAFQVNSASVRQSQNGRLGFIDMDIELENIGIAPIYYPTSLVVTMTLFGDYSGEDFGSDVCEVPDTGLVVVETEDTCTADRPMRRYKFKAAGVEQIIDQHSTKTFTFPGIPLGTTSFQNLFVLSFESHYLYPERPIKFAQGETGTVQFSILPPPPTTTTS